MLKPFLFIKLVFSLSSFLPVHQYRIVLTALDINIHINTVYTNISPDCTALFKKLVIVSTLKGGRPKEFFHNSLLCVTGAYMIGLCNPYLDISRLQPTKSWETGASLEMGWQYCWHPPSLLEWKLVQPLNKWLRPKVSLTLSLLPWVL